MVLIFWINQPFKLKRKGKVTNESGSHVSHNSSYFTQRVTGTQKENTGLHKATNSLLFQPLLRLSLLPGRLWHCNKFLASAHVPELNIGKVALTAITNMGWVPLFFPVPPSVCVCVCVCVCVYVGLSV